MASPFATVSLTSTATATFSASPAPNSTSPDTAKVELAYFSGAAVAAVCLCALLPFVTAFCLGRPFRLLVSKRRTVAVNWLLILLASSVAIRAATLVTLGYFVADAPTQRQCDERTADLKLCGLVVAKRLLEVLISLLYFVGASRMLPHMGYAAHARAFLAGGSKEINYTKLDALTVLGWDISHLVLDRWLLLIQITMVVTALTLDYDGSFSEELKWSTIPIYKALGLQYGVVHVLNGLLYLGVSVAQRDYLQIVLSRTFCPRNLELGEEEDVVGVDEMSNENAFIQLGTDMIRGKVENESRDVSASVVALLKYRREKALERVAGSYAFFGFMTFIAGSLFFVRGVLEGFTEVSYADLKQVLVDPIITSVLPDVVPIICILEVLLPFGLVSYARACFRPVEVMFGSPGSPATRPSSPPARQTPTTNVPPSASTARVNPSGISTQAAKTGPSEPSAAHFRVHAVPAPPRALPLGAGDASRVVALY